MIRSNRSDDAQIQPWFMSLWYINFLFSSQYMQHYYETSFFYPISISNCNQRKCISSTNQPKLMDIFCFSSVHFKKDYLSLSYVKHLWRIIKHFKEAKKTPEFNSNIFILTAEIFAWCFSKLGIQHFQRMCHELDYVLRDIMGTIWTQTAT